MSDVKKGKIRQKSAETEEKCEKNRTFFDKAIAKPFK
jgi:hypothetical protein